MLAQRLALTACFLLLLTDQLVAADGPSEARAIIDQAIEFAGGREALARYDKPFVRIAQGTAVGGVSPLEFKITITTLLPDKQRTDQISKNGRKFQIVFNGEKGWTKSTGGPAPRPGVVVRQAGPDMNEAQIRATRERLYGLWLTTLLPLDDQAFRLSLTPEITIDNRPAVGVNVSRDDHADVQLYFDKETFAPVKLARKVNDRPYEEFYDDYGELDGLVYAKKVVQFSNGNKSVEMQTTELRFLNSVEDQTFEQP